MAGVVVHALVLALGLILPLGVQNVFIFQQGIVQRKWRGVLPVVITAGLCDTLLISVAVAGVSVIVLGLPGVKLILMAAGVLFLIYMGGVTWRSAAAPSSQLSVAEQDEQAGSAKASVETTTAIVTETEIEAVTKTVTRTVTKTKTATVPISAKRQIGFALSVSLLNPHALLDTIGVIGTSSLRYEDGERWAFTLTCIVVSWLWFVFLASAGMTIGRLDQSGRWFRWLNRSSAVLIWGIALYLVVSLYGELQLVIGS